MASKRFLSLSSANWSVTVLALAAAVLLFFYHRIVSLEETTFAVPVEVQVSEELALAEEVPESVRLRLRGSHSAIAEVNEGEFTAILDTTRYTEPGSYQVAVEISRSTPAAEGGALDQLVNPVSVGVVLEHRVRESVSVVPAVRGFPARGYELVRSFVSPETVEIEGPERYVRSRSAISTEEINIAGLNESLTSRVALVPPNRFISVRGGDTVEFRGVIEESIVLSTFDSVSMVTVDLPEGLVLADMPATGSVRLQGALLDLETLSRDDLRLIIDASAIDGPGIFELPVSVEAPGDLVVVEFGPTEVSVDVVEEDVETNQGGSSP